MAARRGDVSGGAELDVLTAGEALVLLAAEEGGRLLAVERFRRFTAGAELNVAIGLARLGLRVGYLSRLGDDAFGQYIAAVIKREGIVDAFAPVDPGHSNGFMLKSLASDGVDPQIEYFRRGSAASRMHAGDLGRLGATGARHLHLTGILPALSPGCGELANALAHRAREQGSSLSFDPNLRPRLWPDSKEMIRSINAFAALSDLVLPGLAEGRLLTGRAHPDDIATFYLELGAQAVVVKLGPDGAYCADRQGLRQYVPGVEVSRVVDTVGAGDGFAVGILSALLEKLPLEAAAQRGCAIGARVVQFPGDSDGLPTRAQLQG